MSEVLLSGIIAGIVSIVAAIISYLANRRALAIERQKFEKQLQRRFTEKLYDLRIAVFPKAMEITEGLRKSQLWREDEPLTQDYLDNILLDLDTWHSTKAAFLLSNNSLTAFREVRKAIRDKPKSENEYSEIQIQRIWKAKGKFRAALRNDIVLLYREELENTNSAEI